MEAAGPAHDQHHADPAVGQRRLGAREREPVVGGEDHERVVGEVVLVERVEHRADALVERARARLVGGHVAPRLGRVGQVGRRQRVERVAHRGRLEVLAVGLEEADREEERLRRALGDQLQRRRRDLVDVVVVDVDDVVVAEHVRVAREVLLADERGPVAGVAQRVDEVVAVVVELEAAVGEARSSRSTCAHWPVSRHGAAAGARRRGAERLAEQQPLVGEPLDVRRRHLMAVGLDVAAGVVGVEIDDVRRHGISSVYSDGKGLHRPAHATSSAPRRAAAARCCARCSRRPASPGGRRSTSSACAHSGLPRQPREYFDGVEDPERARPASRRPTRRRRPRPTAIRCRAALERGHDAERRLRGQADVGLLHLLDLGRARSGRPRRRGAARGRASPEPRYVHVTRRDKVAQAVSLWRAVQTRAWRAGDGERGRRSRSTTRARSATSPASSPSTTTPGGVVRGQRHRAARRSPTRTLAADATRHDRPTRARAPRRRPPAESPSPPLRRQGDDRSARWVERYSAAA